MFLVQEDHEAGGLGVEGGGDVQDGCVDELLDLGVRDGTVLAELVDCAAGLGRLDEGVNGHGVGRLGFLEGFGGRDELSLKGEGD